MPTPPTMNHIPVTSYDQANPYTQAAPLLFQNWLVGYNGKPFTSQLYGRMTRRYRKYVRDNKGVNPLTGRLLPLEDGKAYNPATGKIVNFSTVYIKRRQKNTGDLIPREAIVRRMNQNSLNYVYQAVGNSSYFFIGNHTKKGLLKFLQSIDLSYPLLMMTHYQNGQTRGYTLNNMTMSRLIDLLSPYVEGEQISGKVSDAEFILTLSEVVGLTLTRLESSGAPQGGFFPYTLKIKLPNVEKYELYDDITKVNPSTCCLIETLKEAGVSESVLSALKQCVQCSHIPKRKLREVAEKYHLNIRVFSAGGANRNDQYGDNTKPEIQIGLVGQHYFLKEKTEITEWALTRYEELKDVPEWWKCTARGKKSFKKQKGREMDSVRLFRLLTENEELKKQYLEPLKMSLDLYSTSYYDKVQDDEIAASEIFEEELKPVRDDEDDTEEERAARAEAKAAKKKTLHKWYIDFETVTEGKHTPFLCVLGDDFGALHVFTGYDTCGLKALKYLHKLYEGLDHGTDAVRLYAHNAMYDYVTGLHKHLARVEVIQKGTRLMCGKGFFYNFTKKTPPLPLQIRDSCALISEPLAKFPSMFGLGKMEKEVMPYNIYTEKNVNRKNGARSWVPLKECKADLSKGDRKQFVKNCIRWKCLRGNPVKGYTVDILKYCQKYCERDVDVLRAGMHRFREMVEEATGLDSDDFVSIASLADAYMIKEGCYDGVYQVAGVLRAFIQKCMVGGRVMLANNERCHKVGRIADFDAVGMYNSAMIRMRGFLLGQPELIPEHMKTVEELNKVSGYFVRAKVLKVGKRRAFPVQSYLGDNKRNFTNDLEGKTLYLDDIALNDAIEFQQMEFEIIDGYYFDHGFNTRVKQVHEHLFYQRQFRKNEIHVIDTSDKENPQTLHTIIPTREQMKEELTRGGVIKQMVKDIQAQHPTHTVKKVKNPMQNLFKLLMNSSYGKAGMRPINEELKFLSNANFEKFVSRHYNWIKDITPAENGQGYRVKLTQPIHEHYNRVHIACHILSVAKRIMNEVMCTGEDNGIEFFYTDTDSIHMWEKDVKPLGEHFKKKYGRELIGEMHQQFNIDFDLDGCKDVHSTEFIGLAKKCYHDTLQGTDEKTGETRHGAHNRMKGVPERAILNECRKKKRSCAELYTGMYNGETWMTQPAGKKRAGLCVFDLTKTAEGGDAFNGRLRADMTIQRLPKFERGVCFVDTENTVSADYW